MAPHSYTDPHSGNRFIRFDAAPGLLMVNYKAEVEVHTPDPDTALRELPVGEVPDDVFPYLMATRYCESDVLCDEIHKMFGDVAPGYGRVKAIQDWIHQNITYKPGSTNSNSTAGEVLEQRAGVCRDFAHLGITFCRALNIPARLVVGYVWFDEPPQDFHAVFEAWLGGQWVLFDATRMAPPDRLVRVGTGRDAKDVAFCTFFGPVRMTGKTLSVHEVQDERLVVSAEPAPSGQLLGIEKPVPVAAASMSLLQTPAAAQVL